MNSMKRSKMPKTAESFGNSADLFRFSNNILRPCIVVGVKKLRQIEKASLICDAPEDEKANQILAAAGYRC